ncbi:MAG: hypothetical protein MZV63_57465 [Marinilabiliales bacterium]|nr:hypothetical protein [Marinilabiliales bacterium]
MTIVGLGSCVSERGGCLPSRPKPLPVLTPRPPRLRAPGGALLRHPPVPRRRASRACSCTCTRPSSSSWPRCFLRRRPSGVQAVPPWPCP